MALLSRIIDIPLFFEVEAGCIESLPIILLSNNLHFEKAILIFDEITYEVAGKQVSESLCKMGTKIEKYQIKGSSIEQVNNLRKKIREARCNVIFGVGGGTVLDVGKYSSTLEGINFISIPTTASNDGIASPVAVIEEGGHKKSLGAKMPLGIIADLKLISKSPSKLIRAGIGDLISNLSAVEDWKLAATKGKEKFDNFAAILSTSATGIILNEKGPNILSYNFLKKLVEGLVISGIAMGISGSSRPCSGAEHQFSHALDIICRKRALHGEQVALGTIIATYLRRGNYKRFISFFKKVGIPTNSKKLGISAEEIKMALLLAPSTRPERYTILNEIGINERIAKETIKRIGIC